MRSLATCVLVLMVGCAPTSELVAQAGQPRLHVAPSASGKVEHALPEKPERNDATSPPGAEPHQQAKVQEPLPAPFKAPLVAREHSVIRVLLYHSIGPSKLRPSVKTRRFREQLDWLSEHGIEVIRLSQLLDFLDGELLLPRHAVVITIDDGELNGYSVAYQVLKERGLPFSLGIATRAIQEYRRRGALSWDQLREMVDSGLCEIASHSVTHRAMTSLPDEVVMDELTRSRQTLLDSLGLTPEAFFYPLGDHDRRIRRLTRQSGYRAAFVAHGGPIVVDTPRFWIPRYDVKPDLPMRTFRSYFNHGIRVLNGGPDVAALE